LQRVKAAQRAASARVAKAAIVAAVLVAAGGVESARAASGWSHGRRHHRG